MIFKSHVFLLMMLIRLNDFLLISRYGSTKCGLRQLQGSLLKECKRSKVGVHTASPGMVLTELLLRYISIKNLFLFSTLVLENLSIMMRMWLLLAIK